MNLKPNTDVSENVSLAGPVKTLTSPPLYDPLLHDCWLRHKWFLQWWFRDFFRCTCSKNRFNHSQVSNCVWRKSPCLDRKQHSDTWQQKQNSQKINPHIGLLIKMFLMPILKRQHRLLMEFFTWIRCCSMLSTRIGSPYHYGNDGQAGSGLLTNRNCIWARISWYQILLGWHLEGCHNIQMRHILP